MRDPARIERIARKYAQVWATTPDQRFGQLLSNLHGLGPQEVFYTEDDHLERTLDQIIEEGVNPNYVGRLSR